MNTYTWFWVRSALPKRDLNECTEYNITKANGDVVWKKLVGGNVRPKEVNCNNVDQYDINICSWRRPGYTR